MYKGSNCTLMTRGPLLPLISAAALFAFAALAGAATPARSSAQLSLNENAFGPSPLAIEAIRLGAADVARYTDDKLAATLVSAIATKERVNADQIVLGDVLESLGVQLCVQGPRGGEIVYSV